MSNEEKILEMLTTIQADIKTLKSDVVSLKEKKSADQPAKLSPEERKARQLAALATFQKACAENIDDLAEFFAIMDAKEARRAAAC